jgi:hypothetical protein
MIRVATVLTKAVVSTEAKRVAHVMWKADEGAGIVPVFYHL